MKNWKYYELITYYYGSYFSAIEQNRSVEMAIGSTFEDYFFYPKEENLVSNLVTIIQNIKIQISLLKKVNKGSVDLFKTQLSFINNELLNNELEPNEKEHLMEAITEIEYKLKTIEITESPQI